MCVPPAVHAWTRLHHLRMIENQQHSPSTAEMAVHQNGFDTLGPIVQNAVVESGRTVHFIDDGDSGWQPLLFLGGAGTTVRAFRLLEFVRSLRQQLRIRVISVERNGLGQTPFDPEVGFAEYAADVWSLLDIVAVGQTSVVAISGGGPYAAHIAVAQPKRIRSLHLACAYSEELGTAGKSLSAEQIATDPVSWWEFPPESSVHRIPGFADAVIEEATRSVFARGRDKPPDGLRQAFSLYHSVSLPELDAVTAPAFLYWGSADHSVPVAHMERWQRAIPNVAVVRLYQGEGHDIQYRHWDQILTDVVYLGSRTIVATGRRTVLATAERARELLAAGGSLGLAGW